MSAIGTISTEEQRPLPEGWRWGTVNETGRYINGVAFKPTDWGKEGVPIIRIQNLTDPDKPLNRTTRKVEPIYRIEQGDMMVSWSATLDAFIWDREPSLLNQHIFKVVPDETVTEKRFLFYLLKLAIVEMIKSEHLHGSTMKHINRGPFLAHRVPIPPLKQQRRIVAEIEKQFTRLEAGVAALRRVQANLKHYRAAVLKAACEGQLVPTEAELHKVAAASRRSAAGKQKSGSGVPLLGQEEQSRDGSATLSATFESGAELLTRILAERRKNWTGRGKYKEPAAPDTANLPPLPEGWTWATLDALAAIKGGITKDQNRKFTEPSRSIPYLRVANVQRGYLDLSEVKEITTTEDEIQELLLQRGDILFNEGGDRDKLGRGWVWNDELPECIHQNHVFRARLFDLGLNPKLVSWYANTFGQKFFFDEGKHTTNLASISMTKLKGLPVPIPPPAEQTRIVAEVERRLSVVEELESVVSANLQRATRLRQSILQKAFTGNL